MKTTVISPTAVHALKEALTKIFWIKRDQQSFIHMCVGNSQILSRIDWNDTKRNISATLIDTLSANQLEHKNDLLNLLANIVEMRDFSHLEKFEDGEEKVKSAKKAVEALRQLSQPYHDLMQEKNLAEKRKLDAEVALEKKILNNAKLVDLNNIW